MVNETTRPVWVNQPFKELGDSGIGIDGLLLGIVKGTLGVEEGILYYWEASFEQITSNAIDKLQNGVYTSSFLISQPVKKISYSIPVILTYDFTKNQIHLQCSRTPLPKEWYGEGVFLDVLGYYASVRWLGESLPHIPISNIP